MARNWYKMDFGFWRDEKVRYLIALSSEAEAFEYFKLVAVAYEYGKPRGVLDMNDPMLRVTVLDEMRMTYQQLDELVKLCVSCGLFSDTYEVFGKITSERMVAQGDEIDAAIENARIAGKASAEKRREKAREKASKSKR